MNLIEAIKTGEPFKRKSNQMWLCTNKNHKTAKEMTLSDTNFLLENSPVCFLEGNIPAILDMNDLLADDYLVARDDFELWFKEFVPRWENGEECRIFGFKEIKAAFQAGKESVNKQYPLTYKEV